MAKKRGWVDALQEIAAWLWQHRDEVVEGIERVSKLAAQLVAWLRKRKAAKSEEERRAADAGYARDAEQAKVERDRFAVRLKELEVEALRLNVELEKLRRRPNESESGATRVEIDRIEVQQQECRHRIAAAEAAADAATELVEAADAEDEEQLESVSRGLVLPSPFGSRT